MIVKGTIRGESKDSISWEPLGLAAPESDPPGGDGPQGTDEKGVEDLAHLDTVRRIELAEEVERFCASRLKPDDPIVKFLNSRGYDLGGETGIQRFALQPSPSQGKRWYLPVQIQGCLGEFLIDTGASHSMMGHHFFKKLAGLSTNPVGSGSVRSADGSHMRTHGRQVIPFWVNQHSFVVSTTVAELTDEGILGVDFCSLYGAVLDSVTGELTLRYPQEMKVQCVLRRISGVSSVSQTVRIPPRHVCNVVVYCREMEFDRMGVVEPNQQHLSKLGLVSTSALVQSS